MEKPREEIIAGMLKDYHSMRARLARVRHAYSQNNFIADTSFIVVIDKICVSPIFEKGKVVGCKRDFPDTAARFTKPSAEYYASITHSGNPGSIGKAMHWKDAAREYIGDLEYAINVVGEFLKKEGVL